MAAVYEKVLLEQMSVAELAKPMKSLTTGLKPDEVWENL
tara:strand:+ start:391 stop:507 length:117 start_codon:yes stop_codon:yes gene_type:complete